MLNKGSRSVAKELDLIKFIHRQRINTFTSLAILSPKQRFAIDKMSTLLIKDESDLDLSTEHDMELDQENVPDPQHLSQLIFKKA